MLTPEAQKLWNFRPGTPDGPERFASASITADSGTPYRGGTTGFGAELAGSLGLAGGLFASGGKFRREFGFFVGELLPGAAYGVALLIEQ